MSFYIGSIKINNNLILAPMAGITDQAFRKICRDQGAGLAVSEMVTSDITLYQQQKSVQRLNFENDQYPISVQIVGNDPIKMAESAKFIADRGADIIDINMGCPAKKVLKKAAGSALMQHPKQVQQILQAVVEAVDLPVTLKMRTGWDQQHKNAPEIAKIAENEGIQAITVHGRTRACKFNGEAEYQTIKKVKEMVKIPIIINGDIDSPQKAQRVLTETNADAIMIGRSARGCPWIFSQIQYFLETNKFIKKPTNCEIGHIALAHIQQLYQIYGEFRGVRTARKHLIWYSAHLKNNEDFCAEIKQITTSEKQIKLIQDFFKIP